VDADGMVVSELAAADVDAVVMTPAHHRQRHRGRTAPARLAPRGRERARDGEAGPGLRRRPARAAPPLHHVRAVPSGAPPRLRPPERIGPDRGRHLARPGDLLTACSRPSRAAVRWSDMNAACVWFFWSEHAGLASWVPGVTCHPGVPCLACLAAVRDRDGVASSRL
jgi:hypothetical protein